MMGRGYSPEARDLDNAFYGAHPTIPNWADALTIDEVKALARNRRLRDWNPEAVRVEEKDVDQALVNEINKANCRIAYPHEHGPGNQIIPWITGKGEVPQRTCGTNVNPAYRHDSINRHILLEARCKRLGYTLLCEHCEGRGYVYVSDHADVSLVLWVLYPRKGASCGVEIKNIKQDDLPSIFKFLKLAADRNAERFARVASRAQ